MSIKKIAIRFGDNDFGKTFLNVLRNIQMSLEGGGRKFPTDKERICMIINELSPAMYLTHQNPMNYNGLDKGLEHFQKTRDYLKIEPKRILLDEEVDEYVSKRD